MSESKMVAGPGTAGPATDPSGLPVLAVRGLSVSFDAVDGPARADRPGRAHRTAGAALVEHARDAVYAVRDVSFDLARGRVLALVGESGSGKTVTAMAALGLLPGTARVTGSVMLAGTELIGAGRATLRAVRGGRIGTIFQEPMNALNPVFTVGDQIGEAIRAHRDISRTALAARVRELLATVGLPEVDRIVRSYPHELSGGQLQRAMIAMAISGDPVLLIADEPTTALDVTVQAGILDLLRELRGRLGMAILLITHDMGVVADSADDVVVLRHGDVVERAPVSRLFADPRHDYTRMLLASVPKLTELRAAGDVDPKPRPATAPAPPPAATGGATTVLRNVVVEYRGRSRHRRRVVRAVDDVSLRIDAGQVLGLVGESGSGKSTIGRAMAGLVPVTAGTVTVAGADVGNIAGRRAAGAQLRRLRSRIGIVFQDPASSLNPRWRVGDSIAEPLRLHTEQDAAARRRRVAGLLDAVRLPVAMADRYPYEMSGGQRQRVVLARALALDPALLIADEPTSALDVSVQASVLDLLRSLQRDFGFACLFISHDLAVVQELADRVVVLHRGRVVEQGPARSVLAAPADPYTRRLLAAAPVADPARQAARRAAFRQLSVPDPAAGPRG